MMSFVIEQFLLPTAANLRLAKRQREYAFHRDRIGFDRYSR